MTSLTKNGKRVGRPPSCTCGDCQRCRVRVRAREAYQAKTAEERRAMVEARDPEKVKASDKARYERQKDERLAAQRAYQDTPEGRARGNAAKRVYNERNPEKIEAHRQVRLAVKRGALARGACEQEGPECSGRIEGHHDDYTKPLDVRWLCDAHHKAEHNHINEEN